MKILFRLVLIVTVLYAAVSLAAGYRLAHTTLHPARRPLPADAAAALHAPVEDVAIAARDGAMLRAWYVRAPHPNGSAVILLHGVADNRLGMAGYAPMFLRHGYAVLLPDSRAQGISDGSVVTYGVLERWDVRYWALWLHARAPGCEYLMGESMGGAIAIQASVVTPGICAVVAESSFASFPQIANLRISQYTGLGRWFSHTLAAPAREVAFFYSAEVEDANLADAEPIDSIQQTHIPILLIAGTEDTNIPMAQSQQLYFAGGAHAQLWIVPGAQHSGAAAADPSGFERHVLGWFQTHTNPR
jgi:uncharacterized protein